jgi:hypothetical protein
MSITPITRGLIAAGILAVVTAGYCAAELPRNHSDANAVSAVPLASAVTAGSVVSVSTLFDVPLIALGDGRRA